MLSGRRVLGDFIFRYWVANISASRLLMSISACNSSSGSSSSSSSSSSRVLEVVVAGQTV